MTSSRPSPVRRRRTRVPRPKVEVYQTAMQAWKPATWRTWRWRFRVNGRVMADSGEGYSRRRAAWRAWDHFAAHIRAGSVGELTDGEPGRGK